MAPDVYQLVVEAEERPQSREIRAVVKPITATQERILLHVVRCFFVSANPRIVFFSCRHACVVDFAGVSWLVGDVFLNIGLCFSWHFLVRRLTITF